MKAERRIRRSDEVDAALSYQMQACAERGGLTAMVLAERGGKVVASSRWDADDCATVAQSLAGVDTARLVVRTQRADHAEPRVVTARGFAAHGRELVLCAVGQPNDRVLRELYTAMQAVARIMT
ncbi:MAG: hypothetical protein MUF54_13040 [Polyangiaceae bacterium]|jgi:hypothetical protein|nr:hypothetical protein [Polyangiaceae bacterium]